jgi:S-adenosylmethionine:tRNA ribosyltransferase-isomerase
VDLQPYQFELPDELIARYPVTPADSSRLFYVPAHGDVSHHIFRELPELLRDGDILVFNRTKVSRRRIFLERTSGAKIEVLFLEQLEHPSIWRCMARKPGRLKTGELLACREILFEVLRREGPFIVFAARSPGGYAWQTEEDAEQFFDEAGEPPIPPYLNRPAERIDFDRYQTIFAEKPGSVAAPTAGLHFTPELMRKLEQRCRIAFVDLTIGYGTFAPLQPENFTSKRLHEEKFVIPPETARLLSEMDFERPSASGQRCVAVGTTTLRALESVLRQKGKIEAGSFTTDLFLYPPDRIRSCTALITNFHLPASSLFLLVCAFGGTERLRRAYEIAIQHRYRFYSYGDAMLLESA